MLYNWEILRAVKMNGGYAITCINVYVISRLRLEPVVRELQKCINNEMIFAGNLNAKFEVWGNKKRNSRGKLLLEFYAVHHLYVENDSWSGWKRKFLHLQWPYADTACDHFTWTRTIKSWKDFQIGVMIYILPSEWSSSYVTQLF